MASLLIFLRVFGEETRSPLALPELRLFLILLLLPARDAERSDAPDPDTVHPILHLPDNTWFGFKGLATKYKEGMHANIPVI